MILPPFFGYPIPSQDQEPYRIYYSYLGQDIHTYRIPTPTCNITYVGLDVMTTKQLSATLNFTYLSQDCFTYKNLTPNTLISYIGIDCLTYKKPSNYLNILSYQIKDHIVP